MCWFVRFFDEDDGSSFPLGRVVSYLHAGVEDFLENCVKGGRKLFEGAASEVVWSGSGVFAFLDSLGDFVNGYYCC